MIMFAGRDSAASPPIGQWVIGSLTFRRPPGGVKGGI